MEVVRFGEGLLEKVSGAASKQGRLYLERDERGGAALHLDIELERSLQRLAAFEGFDGHEEMVAWFRGDNPMGLEYGLPQPFFLYRFRVVERNTSIEEGAGGRDG